MKHRAWFFQFLVALLLKFYIDRRNADAVSAKV